MARADNRIQYLSLIMTPEQHPLWPAFETYFTNHVAPYKPASFIKEAMKYWSCFLAGAAAQEKQEQLEK